MKPHRSLLAYLQQVEVALGALRDAYVELYLEEFLTADRANLRVRVRFDNGRLLEVNEALVVEEHGLQHLDYRYQCQDAGNGVSGRRSHLPGRDRPCQRAFGFQGRTHDAR